MQTPCERAAFGGPATAAIAALEGVRMQCGKAELVDAVTQVVKRLADSEPKATGAAGEAMKLGVELGDFAGRGRWGELGKLAGRRVLRGGYPHDYS